MKKWMLIALSAVILTSTLVGRQPGLAQDTMQVTKAMFKGVGGHTSSGEISIVKGGGGYKVMFGPNFSLDSAPDPKIAFGNNGYVKGTIFAKLGKLNGAQSYPVPSTVDLTQYNEIWLWCEKFNVPLAVAKLK